MALHRYELSDFEWAVIQPLLPNKPRGVARADDRQGAERDLLAAANGLAVGGHSRALRPFDHLLQSLCALAEARRMGPPLRGRLAGL